MAEVQVGVRLELPVLPFDLPLLLWAVRNAVAVQDGHLEESIVVGSLELRSVVCLYREWRSVVLYP